MKRSLIYQKTYDMRDAENSELARWAMLDTPTQVDVFGSVWALKSQRVIEMRDGSAVLDIHYVQLS